MVEEPTENRVSTNNEDYDAYDGTKSSGGIVDNPSIHIYIAHQIPDKVTEGEQYEPPEPTNNANATTDPNAEGTTEGDTSTTETPQ